MLREVRGTHDIDGRLLMIHPHSTPFPTKDTVVSDHYYQQNKQSPSNPKIIKNKKGCDTCHWKSWLGTSTNCGKVKSSNGISTISSDNWILNNMKELNKQ